MTGEELLEGFSAQIQERGFLKRQISVLDVLSILGALGWKNETEVVEQVIAHLQREKR